MTDTDQASNTKALTHGLTSERPVIPGVDDEQEYNRYLAGVTENLAPKGTLEEALADRIASLIWRLRRVTRYETAETSRLVDLVARKHEEANHYSATHPEKNIRPIRDAETAREQEGHLVLDAFYLDRILRYESHLHRQLIQTLHELEAMQSRRKGEAAPLARVDVAGSPGAYLAAAREKDIFS